jgi:hypothetical protein
LNAEYATRYTRCSIGSPARLPRLRGFSRFARQARKRPGQADPTGLVQQIKMVAGARNHLNLLFDALRLEAQ